MHNNRVLSIKFEDGSEINVAWVDDNGVPTKGVPTLAQHGYRMNVGGIKDLIVLPNSVKQPLPQF